jgi:D-beta-D-heptose 7-phosphate kinase/D-beta-D-heptose 1-phosphate adenosyltransferase
MSIHKIKTLEEALALRNRLKEAGHKLVLSTGAFDILQIEHVRHLHAARAQGDALMVGLYSDRKIRKAGGLSFPIVPEMERAEVLAALASVDCIVIMDDSDPQVFIDSIAPDFLTINTGDAPTAAMIEKVLTEFGKAGSQGISRENPSMRTEPKQ